MNYTVQELALRYAEALVMFHSVQRSSDDAKVVERAFSDLQDLQKQLSAAAIRAAELLNQQLTIARKAKE